MGIITNLHISDNKGLFMTSQPFFPPFKSVAAALLFSVVLGPVGLLYSSFWGGFFMIFVMLVVVSSKLSFPILLAWITCCIWAVGAVETHNRTIANSHAGRQKE
jgi:hypothetical protein